MKSILSAVCCIFMVAIPVLAQNHHDKGEAGKAMTDQQFVDFAAQTDMVEANLGQLAQDVSDSQPVKDYGNMLATDHTANYQQLIAAAQQASLTVPNAIDEHNNKTVIGPFHELKGAAFDHKFIPAMVSGHTQAIAIFKKEASDAQSPVLKSFAEQTIPTLQKHLDDAKDLEKSSKGNK